MVKKFVKIFSFGTCRAFPIKASMNTLIIKAMVKITIAQKMAARLESRSNLSVIIFAPTVIGKSQIDPRPINKSGIAIRADPIFAKRETLNANLQSFQILANIPASKATTITEARINQGRRRYDRVIATSRKSVSLNPAKGSFCIKSGFKLVLTPYTCV